MEFITDVSETLHAYFYEPVITRFFGLFDVNGRLGVLFLTISYLVAFALYRHRKRRGGTQAPSFWAFLGAAGFTCINRPCSTTATTLPPPCLKWPSSFRSLPWWTPIS